MMRTYVIADLLCSITFEDGQKNGFSLIPSFAPFRVDDGVAGEEQLFALHVNDNTKPFPKSLCERIKNIESGNGDVVVDRTKTGGYQFIIKDLSGESCCLLQTTGDFSSCRCALRGGKGMRVYGLNTALMIVFSFAGCAKNTLLIHASTVRKDNWGYAFTAKSGTGKSTHTGQWLGNIPGCDMMNDDNPVIRLLDGQPYIYGSPWSGKTPCYRNIKARLGAIVGLNRSAENCVKTATTVEAFITLLGSCATMKWDSGLFDNICKTITAFIETAPNYNLYCRPDREAAIICYRSISRSGSLS